MPDPSASDPTIVDWLPVLVIVVAAVFGGVMLTLSIRRKVESRQAERPDPQEVLEIAKARQRQRDDLDARTAEYLDTTQRLAAQLDNKTVMLQKLIADADQRIAELANLTAPSLQPVAPRQAVPDPDPITDSVRELAAAGMSPVEIARRLDEPVGKVELILALESQAASNE